MTEDQAGESGHEFYYDVGTGQVVQGRTTGWASRMGPYPTREAAQHALEQARARTEAWDEEDSRDA
jgi:hypothetical protein